MINGRMMFNYSSVRKCVCVLVMILGMVNPVHIVGSQEPQSGEQGGWGSSTWNALNNPYVVMIVGHVVLPIALSKADDVYVYYWLTDAQREEVLKQRNDEAEAKRVLIEIQKTELQLRKDPLWKELAISEAVDNKRLREHSLRENEIMLSRADRENREAEREKKEEEFIFLRAIIPSASPEKQQELQRQLDEAVSDYFRMRLNK